MRYIRPVARTFTEGARTKTDARIGTDFTDYTDVGAGRRYGISFERGTDLYRSVCSSIRLTGKM